MVNCTILQAPVERPADEAKGHEALRAFQVGAGPLASTELASTSLCMLLIRHCLCGNMYSCPSYALLIKLLVITSKQSTSNFNLRFKLRSLFLQVQQPIFDGSGRWKQAPPRGLSLEDRRAVDERCGELLRRFGYISNSEWVSEGA